MSNELSRLAPLLRSNYQEEAYEPICSSTTSPSLPDRDSPQNQGGPAVDPQSVSRTVTPELDDLPSEPEQQDRNIYNAVISPSIICAIVTYIWHLDEFEIGDSREAWRNVINVLATLFPILYASIVGRLMVESARWKLEKGSNIGFLEQLMGSRTHSVVQQSFYIGIIKHDDIWRRELWQQQGDSCTYGHILQNIVSAPRTAKLDPMDLWGNVKIPNLGQNVTSDWKDVPNDSAAVQYSSLAVIPFSYTCERNTTFTLESAYMYLNCPNASRFLAPENGSLPMKAGQVHVTDKFICPSSLQRPFGELGLGYPNATWHGYDYVRKYSTCARSSSAQWGMAIDRFVDP
ncbi:hypothetical protein BDP55DRAFT_634074 [Colletotrichum godetiae]|uniref:Uncharacterized protein n=1 Tax=Colletotrichum godetiae TaxID=1209918 RepID=A0AAJ0AGG6_9PEZI|nr:uncharacterized protein BDP55DRAFT_634074 [Colletotrichum godetiae]KAK1673458.1 hypothetical protein BDP55DRAFT_634074 [Colletotrichum godetiae]